VKTVRWNESEAVFYLTPKYLLLPPVVVN